jgi:hypothetical protein
MKKIILSFLAIVLLSYCGIAQKYELINIRPDIANKKIVVYAGNSLFTALVYPDSLEKPILYPIVAADGEAITRGYPFAPRAGEPTDHPHHAGLWMNYENVNGLDFWNNSFAIPENKKVKYGWIKTTDINKIKSGEQGELSYSAQWQDVHKNGLLNENTSYIFHATKNVRIIDRITTLTALQNVNFPDAKDGFLGLRVAHELELPSNEERNFTDIHGNVTKVKATGNANVTGNYLTSENKQGDSAWATRARWCMLYGKMGNDTISIAIIDHSKNVGYPTYWHARGYGLFAANPLGQSVFSNGKEKLNFHLDKNQSVTFRYRIIIASGKNRLSKEEIEKLERDFEKEK